MKKRILCLFLAACTILGGCTVGDITDKESETPWEAELVGTYEAEAGSCTGNAYTDSGSATGFEQDGDSCTVTINIEKTDFYDLEFVLKSKGGYKSNYVSVDGDRVGEIEAEGSQYVRSYIRRVYLEAGEHTVTVSKNWGYINWDKVNILTSKPLAKDLYEISAKLVNKNATDNAKRLFSYLCDSYGKYTISGQYCDTGMNGWENLKISENTGGKYPAILGLDMGYYSQTGVDHDVKVSTTEQAIAYWNKGGIVTLCWHWLAPEKYITGTWYSAFRPEEVKMNLTAIMNGKDEEGLALLKKDIDNIAQQLLLMQEAGVPILWRPLHEASGGWFWWGAEGADTYKKLYVLLYDTLTNEYGLNNLIWVWNGQDAEWYPGDEYVDIVGMDIYAGEHEYASQVNKFLENVGYSDGNKMVVLSENGTMINPDLSVRDGAMWGFFCVWGGEFVITDGLRKEYSEQYTDKVMLYKVYNSEHVITRDELPDLHNYPIRKDAK
ncbi:MAG: glycosyl hydrolase [Agathobacter sp.]